MISKSGAKLGVSALMAGCSVVYGWNDLEGSDASLDASIPTADAGRDAPTEEAGASDAGDTEGPPRDLCESTHDICDDFTPTDVPNKARWAFLETGGTSTGTRAVAESHSPPASFRAQTAGGNAALVKGFIGQMKSLTCDFWVLPQPSVSQKIVFRHFVMEVDPTPPSNLSGYFVTFQSAGTTPLTEFWVENGGTDGAGLGGGALSPNQWSRVRIEVTIGAPTTLKLSYNGLPLEESVLGKFPTAFVGMTLKFGALTEVGATGGIAYLDDIVCDITR